MATAVKINFDDVYDVSTEAQGMQSASFDTELKDGSKRKLVVSISHHVHELIPNTYNLAFGPLNANGKIDDKVQIKHSDYSKVFSTVLLHARKYLTNNPSHYLGIDGSSNSRALLYYKYILDNLDYLSNYFIIAGLKYYVRITRFGRHQYENPFDFSDIKSDIERITRDSPKYPEFMYNYFIFKNKIVNAHQKTNKK